MSGNLLYGSAMGLASGIFFRSFFVMSIEILLTFACVTTLAVLLLFRMEHTRAWAASIIFAAVFFSIGIARFDAVETTYSRTLHTLAPYESQQVAIEGVVARDVERTDTGFALFVRGTLADAPQEEILTRIFVRDALGLSYGDGVRVTGILERPEAFEGDLGRIFPYDNYLRAQGVLYTPGRAAVEKLSEGNGIWFFHYIFAFKHAFLRGVEAVLPEPHAGFASGLLLGEKHAIGERLESVFRQVGVIHIIVLSGYNLTIVAESIMRLLSFVLKPRARAFVGACSIAAFAIMVGLSATVVRAGIMALLVLLARATGKTYIALRALALAGMGMILWNPYILVFDPGFQLSFLATLGLMFLSPFIEKVFLWAPTRLQVREYAVSTVATQVFVAPLLLYSVGSISLISIVANVLILVAVPFAMLATFVAGVAALFLGSLAMPLAFPAYALLAYMLMVAETLARVPFASVAIPAFPFWYVGAAYAVLIAVLVVVWKRKKPAQVFHATSSFGH